MEHADWELDIRHQRKSFDVRISVIDADECYLMADNTKAWFWPDVKRFRMFLADLQRIVDEDIRFGVIGWFPRGGSSGATEPAEAPFDP